MSKRWTNSTLRAELGKHGFLEKTDSRVKVVPDNAHDGETWISTWVRHNDVILLVISNNGPPHIESTDGEALDIDLLGFRNVNLRAPGEGVQAP